MDYRQFLAALVALLLIPIGAVVATSPTPADRCRAAGYTSASHILQPDGKTREWLCYSLPSDDLSVPFRSAYLADL